MNKKPFIAVLFIFLLSCSENFSEPMIKFDGNNIETKFNIPDLEGKIFSIDDFKGKFVLINFWATWCAPCVRELPSLNNLHNEFKNNKNFAMIAINIGQNKSVVNKFIKEKAPIDFLVLLDENIELSDWNVQAIPTTFLINDSGKIIYKVEGEKEWDSSEFTKFFKNIIK